ncbi:hypothetical protein BH24ACT10_BH24ACT10_14760 [soil metagenome]
MRRTACAAVLLLGLLGCGAAPSPAWTAGLAWTALPDPPVSPRDGSLGAWTGEEVLFLGGRTGNLCPPTASCAEPEQTSRDGAAYHPGRGTWRRLAPAPVDLPLYGPAATVGDQVFLLVADRLHVYDASDDTWSLREPPPGPRDDQWSLTAADGRVVALRQTQRAAFAADQVLDPATGRWTALPADPLVPAFSRFVVATPYGFVLTGQPEVDQSGSRLEDSLVRAAVLDPSTATWRELPGSDQLQGLFTWTGTRLVDAEIFVADGGQRNPYGRAVPSGGTLTLPDGRWGRLPAPPQLGTGGWRVQARGGRHTAIEGYLYDDAEQRWTLVPQPDGAAAAPGSAVWAEDRLIVLGGLTADEDDPDAGLSGRAYELRR